MNERAKEVRDGFMGNANCIGLEDFLSSLPEFNPPKNEWIKCEDKRPVEGALVWIATINYGIRPAIVYSGFYTFKFADCPNDFLGYTGATHWMPRQVPAPPVVVEEDSVLVKEIKKIACPLCTDSCQWTVDKVIEIVMRHEKKGA